MLCQFKKYLPVCDVKIFCTIPHVRTCTYNYSFLVNKIVCGDLLELVSCTVQYSFTLVSDFECGTNLSEKERFMYSCLSSFEGIFFC